MLLWNCEHCIGTCTIRARKDPAMEEVVFPPRILASCTPPTGGMPHMQLKHQEPGPASSVPATQLVVANLSAFGPVGRHVVPAMCCQYRCHALCTCCPLQTRGEETKQRWISATLRKIGLSLGFPMLRNTLSSMAGSASQSIASFVACRARTNAKKQICIKELETN